MTKIIYAFTDASLCPRKCESNNTGSDIGIYGYMFNKHGHEIKKAERIPEEKIVSSCYAEGYAILKCLEAIVKFYGKSGLESLEKIKIHTDAESMIPQLSRQIPLKPGTDKWKKASHSIIKQIIDFLEQHNIIHKTEFEHVKAHKKFKERRVTNHFNCEVDSEVKKLMRVHRKNGNKL